MNIFQKIKLANQISKTVKKIKEYLKETHITNELKDCLKQLQTNVEKLVKLVPELKVVYEKIMEMICPKKSK